MTSVHAGHRLGSLLGRLRTGVLVGFPSEIGLVRFIWLTKLTKRPLRSYEQPDENTQEMDYSASWLEHYRPENRTQWTMYLLASIPDCRKDSLLIIGPRYEPEIFMARGLGWAADGVRGLDTFSYSPLVDVGDMHDLPYADASFSGIVCGWTLSYSTRPEVAAKEMGPSASRPWLSSIASTRAWSASRVSSPGFSRARTATPSLPIGRRRRT
jgi:hypothetical protein